MQISGKEVGQLAFLSRLDLTADDLTICTKSLNAILGYLTVLEELDTGAVKPAMHVRPIKNVLREDSLQPGLGREQVLANGPEVEDGAFVVPRIV